MLIKTKAYGPVEINEEDIITFDQGIIGFEDNKKFVLLGRSEVEDFLLWLQSVEVEELAFVVIQPRFFKPDYQPKIHISEMEDLDVGESSELLLYAVVVVPEDVKKMTANLRAPIIINVKNNKARQVVLNDESFKVKELIFKE